MHWRDLSRFLAPTFLALTLAQSACTPQVLDFGSDACSATATGCFRLESDKAFVTAERALTFRLPASAENYSFELTPADAGTIEGAVFTAGAAPGVVTLTARERGKPSRFAKINFTIVAAPAPAVVVTERTTVTTGRTYPASVTKERDGITHQWATNNARLTTAAVGDSVQYEAGGLGVAVLAVTARNEAGDEAPPTLLNLQVVAPSDEELVIDVPREVTARKSNIAASVANAPQGATFVWTIAQNGVETTLTSNSSAITFSALDVGEMTLSARAINEAGEAATNATTATIAVVPAGLSLVIGSIGGSGYANGPGEDARFYNPTAMVSLSDGSVVIADQDNALLRLVQPSGETSTIAGQHDVFAEDTGGDGLGGAATFGTLYSLTKLDDTHLFALERRYSDRCVIRTINKVGNDWNVSTIYNEECEAAATTFEEPTAIAVVHAEPTPWLAVATSQYTSGQSAEIYKLSLDGVSRQVFAGDRAESEGGDDGADNGSGLDARFGAYLSNLSYYPGTSALDTRRGLYVVDELDYEHRVRHIAEDGDVTTVVVVGDILGTAPYDSLLDAEWVNNQLLLAYPNRVVRYDSSPEALVIVAGRPFDDDSSDERPFGDAAVGPNAGFSVLVDITAAANGGVYLLDRGNDQLRLLESAAVAADQGVVTFISGQGWVGGDTTFENQPAVPSRFAHMSKPVMYQGKLWIGGTQTDYGPNENRGQIYSLEDGALAWRGGRATFTPDDASAASLVNWPARFIITAEQASDGKLIVVEKYSSQFGVGKVWEVWPEGIAFARTVISNLITAQVDGNGWVYAARDDGTLNVSIDDTMLVVTDFDGVFLGQSGVKGLFADPPNGIIYTSHYQAGYFDGIILKTDIGTGESTVVAGQGSACDEDTQMNINANKLCSEACLGRPSGLALAPNGDLFVADIQAVHRIHWDNNECRVDTLTSPTFERGIRLGSQARFNNAEELRLTPGGDLWVTDSEEVGLYLLRF